MGLFSPESLLRGFGLEPADIMHQAVTMRAEFDAIAAEVAGLQRDREGLREAFRVTAARLSDQMQRIEQKLDDALVMTSMMECNRTVDGVPAAGVDSPAPTRLRLAAGD
jgi:hypothetical protein